MENNKCPNCGSEEIIQGDLISYGGVTFIPQEQTGLIKKSSYICASACKKCGTVFNFKLTDKPTKLTE